MLVEEVSNNMSKMKMTVRVERRVSRLMLVSDVNSFIAVLMQGITSELIKLSIQRIHKSVHLRQL